MKKTNQEEPRATPKNQETRFSVNLKWKTLEVWLQWTIAQMLSLHEEFTAILMADTAERLKISMDDTKKLFNLVFENADKRARKAIWEVETGTEKGNFISNFFKKWRK